MKYKEGDEVMIVKPVCTIIDRDVSDSTSNAYNCWLLDMDMFIGDIVKLDWFDDGCGWTSVDLPFNWLEDWFEPVDPNNNLEDHNANYDRAMSVI